MPEVGVLRVARGQRLRDRAEQAQEPGRGLVAACCAAMRQDEIEGVLAHEIAHIQNGDMVTMTLIQGVVNAFVHVPVAHHRLHRPPDGRRALRVHAQLRRDDRARHRARHSSA